MKLLTCLKIALPAALAVAIAPANALELYYNAYGGFTDPADILPTTPDGFPAPNHYEVQNGFDTDVTAWQHFGWGSTAGEESHLTINEIDPTNPAHDPGNYLDHINGSVEVSDPIGSVLGYLTHHNFPIAQTFTGEIAIHYHLDIYSDAAKTDLLFESGAMDFTLQIWETPNNAVPCPGGDPAGVSTSCADQLLYAAGWQVTPTGGFLDQIIGSFDYDDGSGNETYNVSIAGFYDENHLPQDAFWSLEGQANTQHMMFEVNIPEPGGIALMGIGILGLAFASTRRRRSI